MKISSLNKQEIPMVIQPDNNGEKSFNYLSYFCQVQRKFVFETLHKYGAILFRGFDIEEVFQSEMLASNLGISLSNYSGGDSPRDKVTNNTYTSTNYPVHLSISLHNELSFSNLYPQYLFFYCKTPSIEGGETPIANGRHIINHLSNDLITAFKEKKIKYIMNLHDGYGVGKSWKECFETENIDEIEKILNHKKASYKWGNNHNSLCIEEVVDPIIYHPITGDAVFFSQADQWHPSNLDKKTYDAFKELMSENEFYHNCKFGDDSEIPMSYLNEIREIVSINKISFPWKKNDLMLIDNILTLHGRNPYKGERKVYVCMGSVKHDSSNP